VVLTRYAIDAYLDKPRDSFSWMKALGHDDIDEALWKLRPRPRKKVFELMLHQKLCFLLGVAYPQFLFWLDMGTGKTLLTLELMRYFYDAYKLDRSIILAPGESSLYGWEKHLNDPRWDLGLGYVTLANGATAEKWMLLAETQSPMILASYPGLMHMGTKRVRRADGEGGQMKPDPKKIKLLSSNAQGLVLDESTKVGNHGSKIHKVCYQISKGTHYRYALAGRPFGRDPTPLWAQYRIIDHGATLGPTLELFREAFFSKKKNRWGGKYAYDYTFKASMEEELARVMDHRSITYSIHECIDLPPLVRVPPRIVSLSTEAQGYLDKEANRFVSSRGNFREIKNAFLRMRQISSGFLGFVDDETGERAQVEFRENPKLDDLMEAVLEVPEDCKGIIFHQFTWSGQRICKELKRAGVKHGWLYGGTKDKTSIRREFDDPDSGMQWLVLNNDLGAYSLDLPIANYEFFYESPVSPIGREQGERRAYRPGQDKTTFIMDFTVRGTMDQRILDFHREGDDLMAALMRNPEKMLRPDD